MLLSTVLPTSIIYLPAVIYQEAAQDSWLSVILVTPFGLIAGAVIAGLIIRFPEKTIIQYSELIVGRIPGKIIGLLYALFFLSINTFVIRHFGEIIVTMFMPETPLSFFLIALVATSAYAVRCGLEVLARANEVILPVILALLLLIVALISPEMQMKNFTPALEKGMLPILKGTFLPAVFFAEVVVMVMLTPYMNKPQQAKGTIYWSVVIIGLFQLISTAAAIAVLGARMGRIQFPTIILARQISIAEMIERVEPFVMLIWVLGGIIKVGVFYYCCVLATAQWLKLKEYKALVLPVGVLLTVLSLVLWGDILELANQRVQISPYYLSIEVGLTLLLLVIALLRRKGEDSR